MTESSPHSEHAGPRPGPAALALAIIAIAVLAAYLRTLPYPFLFDDGPAIERNSTIRSLATALEPPRGATVSARPVLNLTFALNHALDGLDPRGYRLGNILIHILAAWTLLGVVRRTLARLGNPAPLAIAFVSALAWAVHPLGTESVTYVVQRAESLMGLLCLATFYLFIRGCSSPRPGGWLAAAVATCALGMATKESMAAAPLLILLYDRTFVAGSLREALRQRPRFHLAMALTWVVLAVLVAGSHGRGGSAGLGTGVSPLAYLLTQGPAILRYLSLSVWPRGLVLDYGTALAPLSAWTVASCLCVAALAGATLWALVRGSALGFLGAWFFAILAPSSSVVPIATETMAEHRMYLPLAALAVLAAVAGARVLGRALLPAAAVVAVLLLGLTVSRNRAYASVEGMWRDVAAKAPGNDRALVNLGTALSADPARLKEAAAAYEAAVSRNPAGVEARYNLACVLGRMPHREGEAKVQLEEVIRMAPDHARAHYDLACLLEREPGRIEDALEHYRQAVRANPGYADAYYNLGCDLARIPGREAQAADAFRTAVVLSPDNARAHFNLAFALDAIRQGTPEALSHYQRAAELQPDFFEAQYMLGHDLASVSGRPKEAVPHLRAAAHLHPADATVFEELGRAEAAAAGIP